MCSAAVQLRDIVSPSLCGCGREIWWWLTENKVKEFDDDRPPDCHGNNLPIGPPAGLKALDSDDLYEGDHVQDINNDIDELEEPPKPFLKCDPVPLERDLGESTDGVAADQDVLGPAMFAQRPRDLVDDEEQHGHSIEHQERELIEQRVREEIELQAVNSPDGGAVRPGTGIPAAGIHVGLRAELLKDVAEVDLLRGRHDGEDVLDAEAEKGVGVADALVVQADLDEEHGQDAVLADVEGDGGVDEDLAPEGALLRVDDDGEDGGDLHGEDEPALGLLELDEGGGDGNGGARHGGGVRPDQGVEAPELAGLRQGGSLIGLLGEADPEGEALDGEVEHGGEADLEDVRDEDAGAEDVLVDLGLDGRAEGAHGVKDVLGGGRGAVESLDGGIAAHGQAIAATRLLGTRDEGLEDGSVVEFLEGAGAHDGAGVALGLVADVVDHGSLGPVGYGGEGGAVVEGLEGSEEGGGVVAGARAVGHTVDHAPGLQELDLLAAIDAALDEATEGEGILLLGGVADGLGPQAGEVVEGEEVGDVVDALAEEDS